ncbi:hypothetical protein [Thalassotalea sp. G2M2-11]|uniref:hypothetical protein n=1 Tax=Thalassotalea sp. G2M2-11 TaxID=2787627 RepID=UPI0019D15F0B|nr:hypothetical protein [Thalassotalea sp. G2M2-11]
MPILTEKYKAPSKVSYYGGLCALIFTIVLAGFGPGYVDTLISGKGSPLILHFHAIVFGGWIALFSTQAILPAIGRMDLHVKLGKFGIGYAVLLVVVGLATTINRIAFYFNDKQEALAKAFLIAPLSDMIIFPLFFASAIAYRHKPEIHKRLMLVATVMLTIAAVGRMSFLPSSYIVTTAVWLSPILIAMSYDFYKKKIIHPAYIIGVATLALVPLRSELTATDEWQSFASWFISVIT